MQTIKHKVGKCKDGVQSCVRCGVIISDCRHAVTTWPEGAIFVNPGQTDFIFTATPDTWEECIMPLHGFWEYDKAVISWQIMNVEWLAKSHKCSKEFLKEFGELTARIVKFEKDNKIAVKTI